MNGLGFGSSSHAFAQRVERRDRRLLRVGDDAVNRLLPVDIGLVLKVAADCVAHRLQQKLAIEIENSSTTNPVRDDDLGSRPTALQTAAPSTPQTPRTPSTQRTAPTADRSQILWECGAARSARSRARR